MLITKKIFCDNESALYIAGLMLDNAKMLKSAANGLIFIILPYYMHIQMVAWELIWDLYLTPLLLCIYTVLLQATFSVAFRNIPTWSLGLSHVCLNFSIYEQYIQSHACGLGI